MNISESQSLLRTYCEQIEAEISAGGIKIFGVHSDPHGHLKPDSFGSWKESGDISWRNSRNIPLRIQRHIMQNYLRPKHNSAVRPRMLVSGQGVGCESSQMRALFPSAEITAVSLTPISPYFILDERVIGHMLESFPFEQAVNDIMLPTKNRIIDLQMIGYFPQEISLPKKYFDIAYDNQGPLGYAAFHKRKLKDICMDAVWRIMESLADEGKLIFTARSGNFSAIQDLISSSGFKIQSIGSGDGLNFYEIFSS